MSHVVTRRTVCVSALTALAAPGASARNRMVTAEQWGVAEIALSGQTDGNPFVDVALSARFVGGDCTVVANGFYDGDGTYRIRFCPPVPGEWRYTTRSNSDRLDGIDGKIAVSPPAAGNHGPVGVADTYHFAYADGTPFKQIGTTSYGWMHQTDALCALTLQTLKNAPFNKLRMAVFPNGTLDNRPVYPFVGTPHAWDTTRFNPVFFRRLETRIGQLRDLGIEADVILFHPYDEGKWGFDAMPREADERYVRYVVARLSAYRNVWWSMANEYDVFPHKTEEDFDRIFQIVQDADCYGRLRSIHHLHKMYDNNKPWVTHASIQSATLAEDAERCVVLRDVWRKPVILDEVQYEGNHDQRWAQLSGEEMVHRFWEGTVAGEYVGHSEFFEDDKHHMWLGTGGALRGISPPRLAFLRKVLEDGPAHGLDPIDQAHDRRLAGIAGAYYLLYFGKACPREWAFSLPKEKLRDGMRFTVDVLDTWNMTIASDPGVYTIKKQGQYDFADERGRAVALPGRPGIALRIKPF
jgi:hypothetical protein